MVHQKVNALFLIKDFWKSQFWWKVLPHLKKFSIKFFSTRSVFFPEKTCFNKKNLKTTITIIELFHTIHIAKHTMRTKFSSSFIKLPKCFSVSKISLHPSIKTFIKKSLKNPSSFHRFFFTNYFKYYYFKHFLNISSIYFNLSCSIIKITDTSCCQFWSRKRL